MTPLPSSRVIGRRVTVRLVGLMFCLVAFAACAPNRQLPGPAITAPHLNDDSLIMADGMRLPLRAWKPDGQPKAVVLALHGFNDYSNAFDDPGRLWARHGVITYAYDQRGFGAAANPGLWAGTAAYVEDLRQAATVLRARHPGLPFYLLGESMGGAVVMVAMAGERPPATDGVILVAPAVWGRDFMPFYQTIPLWFAAHTLPWMHLTGEGLEIRPSDNIAMLRKLSADPLVIKRTRVDTIHGLVDLMDAAQAAAPALTARSLILYGVKDEVVPDNPTFAMIKRLPAFDPPRHRLAIYPKGYHMLMRDLEGEMVISDVLVWLESPHRPLPSGDEKPIADYRAVAALPGSPGQQDTATPLPIGP